jgi:hypothetical protein
MGVDVVVAAEVAEAAEVVAEVEVEITEIPLNLKLIMLRAMVRKSIEKSAAGTVEKQATRVRTVLSG